MAHASDAPEVPPPSLELRRCRELLGHEANDLTDPEIDAMRRHAEAMAHLLIEIFLAECANER